jgi:hypothetical protein
MSVAKYVKKPVVVEAIQFLGLANWQTVNEFIGNKFVSIQTFEGGGSALIVSTNHGVALASQSDWLIKTAVGEVYPCEAGVFESSYDEEEDFGGHDMTENS